MADAIDERAMRTDKERNDVCYSAPWLRPLGHDDAIFVSHTFRSPELVEVRMIRSEA
jgi:hypothetical protein